MKSTQSQNHENEYILEEKSLYKCHYCKQKIDRNDIEKHMMIFHKFIISENENLCEVCDIFFDASNYLLKHIQNVHEGENPNEPEELESLEDGKSKFLKLMSNFKSQEDACDFLYWIKCNDTNLFLTTKEEIENESLIMMENFSNVKGKVISNDETLSESKIVQDDFNEEYDEEEIEKNSGLSLLDYENKRSCKTMEKNMVKCNECQESFFGRPKLITHIRSVHMQYKCEPCGKKFTKPRMLKKHNHEIHGDFKCGACGKSFSQIQTLKRHIHTIHRGQKDYKCESCGKSFSQAEHLRKHIHTIHDGQKDYKCDSCSKSFSDAGYLKLHVSTIHGGNKDYKCKSCPKSFSQTAHLNTHTRTIHEGRKDYKCTSCGKCFSLAGTLKQHIQNIHKDRPQRLKM